MSELMDICVEIKRDLQGVIKSLALNSFSKLELMQKEYRRKEDIMILLGISSSTFDRYAKARLFPVSKIKGLVFVKSSDIEKLINDGFLHSKKK